MSLFRSYFFWGYVILLSLLTGIVFLYISTPIPASESSDQLIQLYQGLSSRKSFREGTAALRVGDLERSYDAFSQTLVESQDIDEQGYLKYLLGLSDPVVSRGVTELKAVVEGNGYTKITRALAASALGTRTVLDGNQTVMSAVFAQPPYSNFLDRNDRSVSYRHLFEYASSFYPTAESELQVALWYADVIYKYKRKKTTLTPQEEIDVRSWRLIIERKLQNAAFFEKRIQSLPDHFEYLLPRTHLLRARVLGTLRLSGEETLEDPRVLYDSLITDRNRALAVESRFYYALYLDYFYGDTVREEISALVHSLYMSEQNRPYTKVFMEHVRNESLDLKSGAITLAFFDPAFQAFLVSIGWKDSDFE